MQMLSELLTLFTTCKPFAGDAAVMQKNALTTWQNLETSLMIFGAEKGVAQYTDDTGAINIRDIQYHSSGMPYVDEVFTRAQQLAKTPFCCYINSDILLPEKTQRSIAQFLISADVTQPFLLTARRKNIPLNTPLPNTKEAQNTLLDHIETQSGNWDTSSAIDIFLFPTGMLQGLPSFLFGRMQWDNWLLWKAKDLGATIIDASHDMHLLHPIHGYAGDGTNWLIRAHGKDSMENRRLAGQNSLSIKEACSHILKNGSLVKATSEEQLHLEKYCGPDPEKELTAGIQCLSDTYRTMNAEQIIDFCRTLLWRAGYFFPCLIDAHPSDFELESTLKVITSKTSVSEKTAAAQQLVAIDFWRILKDIAIGKRPIYIWGAGNAGRKMLNYVFSGNVNPIGFLDSDITVCGSNRHGLPVAHPDQALVTEQGQQKPFILLASMYAQEITLSLEAKGYTVKQDYLG